MTATTVKKRTAKPAQSAKGKAKVAVKSARAAASKPKKPLRIREELLPDSAMYITVNDVEYIALPVAEFGDWYEDALDTAVIEEQERNDNSPDIPVEQIVAEVRRLNRPRR